MHVEGFWYFNCIIAIGRLMKMYHGKRQLQLDASVTRPQTKSRYTTQKLLKLYLAFMTFGSFSHLLVCRLLSCFNQWRRKLSNDGHETIVCTIVLDKEYRVTKATCLFAPSFTSFISDLSLHRPYTATYL